MLDTDNFAVIKTTLLKWTRQKMLCFHARGLEVGCSKYFFFLQYIVVFTGLDGKNNAS